MGKTILILGAGASKMAGAPLMNDFFDLAEDTLFDMTWDKGWLHKYGSMTEGFRPALNARSLLQSAHSKGDIDLYNLESVFAAFEMAKLYGQLGPLGESELDRLPDAMKQVIATTLEWNIQFGPSVELGFSHQIEAPKPYGRFADMLFGIAAKWTKILNYGDICVLTFNYDLCVDYALESANIHYDYCLAEPFPETILWLLKLHGSLNWTTCPKCNKVVPWLMRDFGPSCWDTGYRHAPRLLVSRRLKDFKHCDTAPASSPMIVPPTWNKHPYYSQVGTIWHAAARVLKSAENIFIFGYSLPPTDQFFRYLYAIGTIGDTPLRRFWVFDPDPSGLVEKRFRDLLGLGATRRFQFFRLTFDEAITEIMTMLNLVPRTALPPAESPKSPCAP